MLPPVFRKRRLQLALFVFVLAAVLVWHARGALTPFFLGLVVAYLVLPLVGFIQRRMPVGIKRRNLDRPLAILLVYLLGLLVMVGVVGAVIPPIINQVVSLYQNADELYGEARTIINEGIAQYEQVPPDIKSQVEQQLQSFNPSAVLTPVFQGVRRAVGAIGNTVGFMLGLIVIPFWLFFILNDEESVMHGAMGIIPHDLRPDVEAIRIIFDRVLSAYIRGQLIVAAALGIAITIGLLVLQVPYSLLLGLAAGALGLFPFVGAILGAIPAIIVAFLESPQLALWVVGLFVIVQQIDNVFVSPKIMGEAVALHPALIMVVIVAGSSLFGVVGALVAVPLTAIVRDVVNYFYIRVGDEGVGPREALHRVGYGRYITPAMQEMIAANVLASRSEGHAG